MEEKVKVYWINLGYHSGLEFDNVEQARSYASKAGYEAIFQQGNEILGSWSMFGGYKGVA